MKNCLREFKVNLAITLISFLSPHNISPHSSSLSLYEQLQFLFSNNSNFNTFENGVVQIGNEQGRQFDHRSGDLDAIQLISGNLVLLKLLKIQFSFVLRD